MLKSLKALARRDATGSLSGKQLSVGERVVKVDKLLGEGGFATIYRCTDVETGAVFALKHFRLTGSPDAERDVGTEVGVMERLAGCPHVVRLHEAAFGGPPGAPPTAAFVLMDFCPDTLVSHLQQRGWRLEEAEVLAVFLPVCRAVAAMHALDPPLAHRDLKAENVLLGPGGAWVLCDFGSASAAHGVLESARDIALEEEVVRKYTTPAYRAPELFDLYAREYIGLPVDIWALGVLLYLLAFGRLPFEGEAKLQVLNGRYTMPEGRAPELRALIKDMLAPGPLQRPTIQQVLARLQRLAPPELWAAVAGASDQQQQSSTAAGAAAAATPSGSSAAAPLHERVPSQGWADFGSGDLASPGGGGSGGHSRRQSGSLASWATFSPKRAAEAVASAAGGLKASAGSFWSSFGEEAPSDAQEGSLLQQERSSSRQAGEPAGLPEQQPAPPAPPARQPAAPAPAAAAAAASAAKPAAAPAPAALSDAAGVSPLSAGLARMNLGPPAAPTAPRAAAPAPQQQQQQRRPPAAQAGSQPGSAVGDEAEMLREHCRVLEQLLEERGEEVAHLRTVAEQQAAEILALRQQLQQLGPAPSKQQPASSAAASAAPAATPLPAPSASSTPASSRMAQDVQPLQVPGSGDSWVSFSGVGGREQEAPTPTLLQPASSARGSTARPSGSAASAAEATPASAAVPAKEEALRAKLDLSSAALAGATLGPRGSAGLASWDERQAQRVPMRSGGSGSGLAATGSAAGANGNSAGMSSTGSGTGSGQLRSYTLPATPAGPSVASSGPSGTRSAPASAQPSPLRSTSVAAAALAAANSGSMSPAQSGSPMHSRPGSSLGGRSLSPSKQHRRNVTAPQSFFEDLDPLH